MTEDTPLTAERKKRLDNVAKLGALLGIYDPETLLDIEAFLSIPGPVLEEEGKP